MKISERGELALRIMLGLARTGGEPADIADGVPPEVSEDVMTDLERAGLVEASPDGGHILSVSPSACTAEAVLRSAGDGADDPSLRGECTLQEVLDGGWDALWRRYVLLDHTADMMVRAYGRDLEECFANAGYAIFDQTVDLSGVACRETLEFEVSGIDEEDRLYSFLSELLFYEDADGVLLKDLKVRFDGDRVLCRGEGERLDRSRHRVRSEIKAVTYHMMDVDPEGPSVTVLFDVRSVHRLTL